MEIAAAATTPTLGQFGGLAALLLVSAALVWFLYARSQYVLPVRATLSFFQHLREFVARLGRAAALFGYWTVVLLLFRFDPVRWGPLHVPVPAADLFDNMAARLYLRISERALPDGVQVIVTRPTEAVAAQLQVAMLVAFVLAFPALAYEAWAFFSPGLEPRERRALARSLPVAFALFVAGAIFGALYIVPFLLKTLYGFAAPVGAASFLTAGALVGTVVTFAFLFGLAFELPLALVLLVRLRIVTPERYVRHWRGATFIIFVVAALVTDPTLVSQLLVGTILLLLWWGGVLASFLLRPRDAAQPARARPTTRSA